MEIEKVGNKIVVVHKLKQNEMYKFSKGKTFESVSVYKKPQILKGVSSRCEDGKHTLFIDFDNVPRWLVIEDYLRIQKEYDLPQAYLFTTSEDEEISEKFGNYHIISLCKHYPKKIYEILSNTHADVNFMSMPLRRKYRGWILRISDKLKKDRPKFVQVIGGDINKNIEVSKPHFDFLNKIYNLKKINYKNFCKCKRVFLQEYEAS